MTRLSIGSFFLSLLLIAILSCKKDPIDDGNLSSIDYAPTPHNIVLPSHFPQLEIPADNPLTKEGIWLGRQLFYDPILSLDSTMSCASCHLPEYSFTDILATSKGIDGTNGSRSAMSLVNVGFVTSGLFWDGRVKTLEDQALIPVEDPIELHHTWPDVVEKFKKHPIYPSLFRKAFGITNKSEINKEIAAKALAQFERTLISKDSKYDRVTEGKEIFTDMELIGFGMYFDLDPDVPRAECGHCHNAPLAASNAFFNNGISEVSNLSDFLDLGRGKVTGSIADNGKFRAPTLRNIKHSAPYMHDGRFSTFDHVLNHYNSGGKSSPNADPLIHTLKLSPFYINALKAFIDTFEDTTFYNNPEFKNPFK